MGSLEKQREYYKKWWKKNRQRRNADRRRRLKLDKDYAAKIRQRNRKEYVPISSYMHRTGDIAEAIGVDTKCVIRLIHNGVIPDPQKNVGDKRHFSDHQKHVIIKAFNDNRLDGFETALRIKNRFDLPAIEKQIDSLF